MNFMGIGWDGVAANGDGVGMGLKLMGMGWGRENFCGDEMGLGLMSTTVSLFNTKTCITDMRNDLQPESYG